VTTAALAADRPPAPLEAPPERPGLRALRRHAEHPSAYLALNAGTRWFTTPGVDGLCAFRESGRWWFQLGGPIAAPAERAVLQAAFERAAAAKRRRVCAVQLRPEELAPFQAAGYRINQLGAAYSVDLARFSTRGKPFVRLRNKVNRARRAGVEVGELGRELPRDAAAWAELEALTARWLGGKGRGAKLLRFLTGELGRPDDDERRVFVARRGGAAVGFVTYGPSFGPRPGRLHDLSRRDPDGPPGVMELVNLTAIERFRSEGVPWLHLGVTPFAGLAPERDAEPTRSRLVGWLTRLLAERGEALYPARSQAAYKRKWLPDLVAPVYVAWRGRYRPSMTWRLLTLTRAV